MAYFRVSFQGKGIRLPFDDGDPAIGFFTTRVVQANSPEDAADVARRVVLAEWRDGGAYAAVNTGEIPRLSVESVVGLGLVRGLFGRKPAGYTFYRHED